MNYNDILKRIRYSFDLSDDEVIRIFELGGLQTNRSEISNWMKPEADEFYVNLVDEKLAHFLNGFIVERRGEKEGPKPETEKQLNNNIILRKLIIALNLKSDEAIAVFELADMHLSKHELSAFFRKKGSSKYRQCKDQFLRNFIHGVQIKYRPESEESIKEDKSSK